MQTKAWTRIEIGYELCLPSPSADPKDVVVELQMLTATLPNALSDLCKIFKPDARLRWVLGGSTEVNSSGSDHEWVAELLTKEINAGLAASAQGKSVSFDETKLLESSRPSTGGNATADKPIGTRCLLLGDRWINNRSYRIEPGDLGVNLPKNVVFFASLLWPCEGARSDTGAILSSWLRSVRTEGR